MRYAGESLFPNRDENRWRTNSNILLDGNDRRSRAATILDQHYPRLLGLGRAGACRRARGGHSGRVEHKYGERAASYADLLAADKGDETLICVRADVAGEIWRMGRARNADPG